MEDRIKLCADVGGTSVRFGYVDSSHNIIAPKEYEVATFDKGSKGFSNALFTFLHESSESIDFNLSEIYDLILCVAGRVQNGNVKFTNSNWIISSGELKKLFKNEFSDNFEVRMLNDFEALAYGLTTLIEDDLETLEYREGYGNTKIVCGPGTGLGLAALHQTSEELIDIVAIPSEAGHQTFPVQTETQRKLREYLQEEIFSYEDILSGEGLQSLYNFFSQGSSSSKHQLEPEEIIKVYKSSGNEFVERALIAFAHALGNFCGNMALAFSSTQGVFLWGGILKSFPYEILQKHMLSSFKKCGLGTEFLVGIPVYIITNDKCALKGCSIYCDIQRSKQ